MVGLIGIFVLSLNHKIMNKQDKQRLINAVLEKNPNCTECGVLIKNYNFEYEPKFYPLDGPVVATRADNGRKWVMCKSCCENQAHLRNKIVKSQAALLIDKNSIQRVSIKDLPHDQVKKILYNENIAVNILLAQYGVPKEVISEVKSVIRNQFHVNYYLRYGKFLTEKDGDDQKDS